MYNGNGIETILNAAYSYIKSFGLLRGLFALFFIFAHCWIYRLYYLRVKDAKDQIDRLAEENKEYRDRFLSILDERFNYKPKFVGSPLKSKPEKGKKI